MGFVTCDICGKEVYICKNCGNEQDREDEVTELPILKPKRKYRKHRKNITTKFKELREAKPKRGRPPKDKPKYHLNKKFREGDLPTPVFPGD